MASSAPPNCSRGAAANKQQQRCSRANLLTTTTTRTAAVDDADDGCVSLQQRDASLNTTMRPKLTLLAAGNNNCAKRRNKKAAARHFGGGGGGALPLLSLPLLLLVSLGWCVHEGAAISDSPTAALSPDETIAAAAAGGGGGASAAEFQPQHQHQIVHQHRRELDDVIITTTVTTLVPTTPTPPPSTTTAAPPSPTTTGGAAHLHQSSSTAAATTTTTPASTTPSTTTSRGVFVATGTTSSSLGAGGNSREGGASSANSLNGGNEITGTPDIECGHGVVRFNIKTSHGKNVSAVFVRGQNANPDCVFHNTREAHIDLSKCNIRRKREVTGVEYVMTVVVQMHPLFITKLDRAYRVNCFYMEKPQDVSSSFNVSDMETHSIQADHRVPNCTYSVHRDSPNGPMVKYTRVGEQLYHVWECPSSAYAMLLHSCHAVDGSNREFSIVDEQGCSKDEFLMPQITYTGERNKAIAASAAFNFPDRNTMLFQCKIKLCYNSDAECHQITPPVCNGRRNSSGGNNFVEPATTNTLPASGESGSGSGAHQPNKTSSSGGTVESAGAHHSAASSSSSGTSSLSTTTSTTTTIGSTSVAPTTQHTTAPSQHVHTLPPAAAPHHSQPVVLVANSHEERPATGPGSQEGLAIVPAHLPVVSPKHQSAAAAASPSSAGVSTEWLVPADNNARGGGKAQATGQQALVGGGAGDDDLPADFPRPGFLATGDDKRRQRDSALQEDHVAEHNERSSSAGRASDDDASLERPRNTQQRGEGGQVAEPTTANNVPRLADANVSSGTSGSQEDDRYIPRGFNASSNSDPAPTAAAAAQAGDAAAAETSTVALKLLKKGGGGGGGGGGAGGQHFKRDTTVKQKQLAAAAAAAARQPAKNGTSHGTVDFDITSPELTIIDDYEPSSVAHQKQQRQQQQQQQQGVGAKFGANADENNIEQLLFAEEFRQPASNDVCVSPAVLAMTAALFVALAAALALAAAKLARRMAASHANTHHFSTTGSLYTSS